MTEIIKYALGYLMLWGLIGVVYSYLVALAGVIEIMICSVYDQKPKEFTPERKRECLNIATLSVAAIIFSALMLNIFFGFKG